MIYLHKNYVHGILYDFTKNTYKSIPYDKKLNDNSSGNAEILNNQFLAMVVYEKKLYFITDHIQIPFDKLNLELKSKDIDDVILERTLIIKNDEKIVDTIIYTIDKVIISQQLMYTEMAELEDYDFGLFAMNILNNKERQEIFLEVSAQRIIE